MRWKVVARADNPDQQILSTLEELTGLGRGEVLLALRKNGLTAGDGLTEERASALSSSLSGFGLDCTVLPSPDRQAGRPEASLFRVVLTGYRPGSRARLRERLEKLSGLPPEQVVLWLAKIPFVLKDGIDHETARRIRRALSESGGIVELKPVPGSVRPVEVEIPQVEPSVPATAAPREKGEDLPPPAGAEPEEPGEDPPPPPDPPVMEGGSTGRGCPPILRFVSPGCAPPEPPFIPGPEELGRTPPGISFLPPPVPLTDPPEPEQAFHLFVSVSSKRARSEVESILQRRLDLKGPEAALDPERPFWVAATASAEKAMELSCLLEEAGATVIVSCSREAPSLREPGGRGFLSWIRTT